MASRVPSGVRQWLASGSDAGRLARSVASFASLTLGLAVLVGAHGDSILPVLRGEVGLDGSLRYAGVPARGAARDVDLAHVHTSLLPTWSVAAARGDARLEARTFERLQSAVGADSGLAPLARRLRAVAVDSPELHPTELTWVVYAWNTHVERAGSPYRVDASTHAVHGRHVVSLRTYRVVEDLRTRGTRVRFVTRVDGLRSLEPYLGRSGQSDDGAIVVADRVLDFAARDVWPLLDPALDDSVGVVARAFAPSVRASAARSLPPVQLALLRSTAIDAQRLARGLLRVRTRHTCEGRLAFRGVPWAGLDLRTLARLNRVVREDLDHGTPCLTPREADELWGAQARLQRTIGLRSALESLTAWTARAVAVHELRHVADGDARLDCVSCPASWRAAERAEARAYLASFEDPVAGPVALLQACLLGEDAQWGAGSDALAELSRRVLPNGCSRALDAPLAARARAVSVAMFGEDVQIPAPTPWPLTIRFLAPAERVAAR